MGSEMCIRDRLGGGTRQVGILAAAGLYALEHNVERLAEDHEHAARLAEGLGKIEEIEVHPAHQRTNMVFVSLSKSKEECLASFMRDRGILLTVEENPIRLVTHLDIERKDIDETVDAFKEYFRRAA